VPFPQLFAKGKSLKSKGIVMPRDKNKGVHGDLGHVEPILKPGPCRTNTKTLSSAEIKIFLGSGMKFTEAEINSHMAVSSPLWC
jgi:hypothetical protein